MEGNLLSGEIPELPVNLKYISLRDNRNLKGNLNALTKLTNLTYIYMSRNQFTGSVPNLQIWPELLDLDISHNQLSGIDTRD